MALRGDDADEFASWAKEKLWEDDYRLLRKWRGESKLTTYLAVVLTNLGREFRVRRWGRWRPSAAALRLGPLAVRVERLVHRDGLRAEEAAELLRTGRETTASDRVIADLAARLPRRTRTRVLGVVDPRQAEAVTAADRSEGLAEDAETAAERDAVHRMLRDALAQLPAEERTVLTMHYFAGHTLADVSRALDVPQKPLYRLREGALRRLRARLAELGATWEVVQRGFDMPLPAANPADQEFADVGPSKGGLDAEGTKDAPSGPPQHTHEEERMKT
jgi:RNA polymerase sigma factor for flagellar operon FliA